MARYRLLMAEAVHQSAIVLTMNGFKFFAGASATLLMAFLPSVASATSDDSPSFSGFSDALGHENGFFDDRTAGLKTISITSLTQVEVGVVNYLSGSDTPTFHGAAAVDEEACWGLMEADGRTSLAPTSDGLPSTEQESVLLGFSIDRDGEDIPLIAADPSPGVPCDSGTKASVNSDRDEWISGDAAGKPAAKTWIFNQVKDLSGNDFVFLSGDQVNPGGNEMLLTKSSTSDQTGQVKFVKSDGIISGATPDGQPRLIKQRSEKPGDGSSSITSNDSIPSLTDVDYSGATPSNPLQIERVEVPASGDEISVELNRCVLLSFFGDASSSSNENVPLGKSLIFEFNDNSNADGDGTRFLRVSDVATSDSGACSSVGGGDKLTFSNIEENSTATQVDQNRVFNNYNLVFGAGQNSEVSVIDLQEDRRAIDGTGTQPGVGIIRPSDSIVVENLSQVDLTRPEFLTIEALEQTDSSETLLEIDFSENISSAGGVSKQDLTFLANGSEYTGGYSYELAAGSNAGTAFTDEAKLVLKIADASNLTGQDVLQLSYSGGDIEDTAGNTLRNAVVEITNNKDDNTNPEVTSATVSSGDGKTISLSLNEDMEFSSGPASGFSITVNGEDRGLTHDSSLPTSGKSYNLFLDDPIGEGDTVLLSYTAPSGGGFIDTSGQTNALVDFEDFPVDSSSIVRPIVTDATISSTGTEITININEPLTANASANGFTVKVDGSSVSIDSVAEILDGDQIITLSLSEAADISLPVTLSYSPGNVQDKDSSPSSLRNFTDLEVAVESSDPVANPYTGPVISAVGGSTEDFNAEGGNTVTVEGSRLSGVTKAIIDGKEAEILSTSADSFEIVIPEGIAPGTYDLEIESSIGNLTYLDAITIGSDETIEFSYGEMTAWTKRISHSQAKVYVKFPTVGEKVRIGHQTGGSGSYETVYVKTTSSETMDGLRIVEGIGTYIVRTIDLADINRIRVTVGDETPVQVRYNN